ncbi:MAG: putative colanic acid biosynthesis acetyltransferase [Verrucomicrobiota bacterium]
MTPPSPEKPYMGQGNVTPYPRSEIALRVVWSLVQATLFRWCPRPWHAPRLALLRLFGAEIPDTRGISIYPTADIIFPWKLTLHAHVTIGPGVRLYNLARITLRRGAKISQHCHLCAGTHNHELWAMPLVTRPIEIGENAWLGTEVFVGPGVTVGELCVIGARAVVVKDQPPAMICAGNPCRPLKARSTPS